MDMMRTRKLCKEKIEGESLRGGKRIWIEERLGKKKILNFFKEKFQREYKDEIFSISLSNIKILRRSVFKMRRFQETGTLSVY